jgi:hypothetical protein
LKDWLPCVSFWTIWLREYVPGGKTPVQPLGVFQTSWCSELARIPIFNLILQNTTAGVSVTVVDANDNTPVVSEHQITAQAKRETDTVLTIIQV